TTDLEPDALGSFGELVHDPHYPRLAKFAHFTRLLAQSIVAVAAPPLRYHRAACYRGNRRGGHALDQENPRGHRHLRTLPQRTSVRLLFCPNLQSVADRIACRRYRVDRRFLFP